MATTSGIDDTSLGAVVLAPSGGEDFWPVATRWAAVVEYDGILRAPEWILSRAKAVPLSSRIERSLLEAVRADDGRAVLARASENGEHRVAAATIAALRLAADHPERALRFLGWLRQSPDDPASLRFLRRYLPGLDVLVRLDPDLGVAMPLSHGSLGLLAADLFRSVGDTAGASRVLESLPPSAPVALARASLRLHQGDYPGVRALAQDRPIVDDVTVALRILDAAAVDARGDHGEALTILQSALDRPDVAVPVERMGRALRARALRASGREVEASLVDEDFATSPPEPIVRKTRQPEPEPPLFGRSLVDAMDDAWARVRRQDAPVRAESLADRDRIDAVCEQAIALVRAGHLDTAESDLLASMDRADAWVDQGGAVIEDFYVLLAGVFAQQGLTIEEVATLERLRSAHQRAGSSPSDEVLARLTEARVTLDGLA